MNASEIVKWFIVAWFAYGALVTIGQIGKPRKPLQPAVAVVAALIATGLIVLVIVFWGGES
jgi:hypothetical protein